MMPRFATIVLIGMCSQTATAFVSPTYQITEYSYTVPSHVTMSSAGYQITSAHKQVMYGSGAATTTPPIVSDDEDSERTKEGSRAPRVVARGLFPTSTVLGIGTTTEGSLAEDPLSTIQKTQHTNPLYDGVVYQNNNDEVVNTLQDRIYVRASSSPVFDELPEAPSVPYFDMFSNRLALLVGVLVLLFLIRMRTKWGRRNLSFFG